MSAFSITSAGLRTFTGLRAAPQRSGTATKSVAVTAPRRVGLVVEANKRVKKMQQVVLIKQDNKLGAAGDIVEVSNGFFRNNLEPMGIAKRVTAELMAEVAAVSAAEVAAANAEVAGAKAIATALATIGKFVVKAKVGEEGKIFGSVSAQDAVDAIMKQTGKTLDKKAMEIPDISAVGIYECTVKLHADVVGKFKLDVQKA
eukprot:CAMPEP_0197585338 /NCGR_PEP_ID=MMETSP1326-20131121/7669_1 /TAXON_ID=1155430 /ORGANISM="Genus nov. species nov., Strain RCC2288" /LENGTH=200 /DNA_ID=CAMNT_0043149827 /DNA_START=48 /DNA_END=650 /DNA_ORIENTATION=+